MGAGMKEDRCRALPTLPRRTTDYERTVSQWNLSTAESELNAL